MDSRGAMPRGKQVKRRPVVRSTSKDNEPPRPLRMRLEGERRSKASQDTRWVREKGARRQSCPLAKKKRVQVEVSDEVEEGQEDYEEADDHTSDLREQSWSRGYETGSGREDSGGDREAAIEAVHTDKNKKRKSEASIAMKKPIELDANGDPHGVMREALAKDVVKYAKSLDPTKGWEGQSLDLRKALFQRLYSDWETCGHSRRVSERFLAPIITKSLITLHFKLNQMIDREEPMPEDYNETYWQGLVDIRNSDDSKAKSAHMRAISKSKGTGSTQMKAVERQVVSRLTLVLGRSPFDLEIDAEVAKELKRISEEKKKGRYDYGGELEELRSRMTEVEGSMGRLELSQLRIEGMLKALLTSKEGTHPQSLQDEMEPFLFVQVAGGPHPMSQGAAAWVTVQKDFFLPMLKSAAPTVDIHIPATGDIVADTILVQGDVSRDIAGAHKDVVAPDHAADVPFEVVSLEASKSADVPARCNKEEVEEEEDDAYKLLSPSAIHPAVQGVASEGKSSNPQQHDVEAPADSSSRPRRSMKTISTTSEKVVKLPPKTNVPKPKIAQGTSKASSGKRSPARKKRVSYVLMLPMMSLKT